jgi:hypothetical protein
MKTKESSQPQVKEWQSVEKEREKFNKELELEKIRFIEKIKNLRKEEILPKQPEKLSLWKRIQRVLMGL